MAADLMKSGADGMQTVLRVIPMPADLGVGQRITTGWLLAKLDQAGSVLPSGIFGRPAVLAACEPLEIKLPVHLGDCVTFRATVIQAEPVNAMVKLQVLAEKRGETTHREITTAIMRYVAVDEGEEDSLFSDMFASRLEF